MSATKPDPEPGPEVEPDDGPRGQDHQWSRASEKYEELFLDAFHAGVENPVLGWLDAVPDPGSKTVADLGCGTGPLLPNLAARFGHVVALDFAPGMIARARRRLDRKLASKVKFLTRPMDELGDYAGRLDVAVAVNSVVMPDVRVIDRTLRAVRAALKPDGVFLGVVPSIDAIHYHTMLLMDQSLDRGSTPEEAERYAAHHAEHVYYDFAMGRFRYRGLHQKFWHPFEVRHRLAKAGFTSVELAKVTYPWDDSLPGGTSFADQPPSWDWSFIARP